MTGKYKETDALSDLISDDYRMLQMISHFGITLGFGDQDIATACRAHGVDTPTFLAVVNYVKGSGKAHINELAEQVELQTLMQYLAASHAYFVDYRLPSIRRKLLGAIDCSSHNQVATLILRFYDEYAADVLRHMEYEDTHVHPYVLSLLQGNAQGRTFGQVVGERDGNHASIEKSIAELKSIIIKYNPRGSNAQLLNDVLMDIYMTEEELLIHCHLEDTLFAECVRLKEKDIERNGPMGTAAEEDGICDGGSSADGLSEREKEIIVQVVRGLSNKEIAEALFISVNTVMTHRRNISRKLQIHSPAALTIYAIVNGLVNLEDVTI